MLVPDNEWIYAPYLMFDARSLLAPILTFSERLHRNAYSIPSIAIELGVRVQFLADASYEMIGRCTRCDEGFVITLNDAIDGTGWEMTALIHELGHAVVPEAAIACQGKLQRMEERNAWVRGIYCGISRPLVEAIGDQSVSVREVAGRCAVPTSIVRARMAIAALLGEVEGDISLAYEDLRVELLMIAGWIEEGKSQRFREWSVA